MSIIQLDETTGKPIQRMREYEIPLSVTFEEQFKNTDILVFCSTFTNVNSQKSVCSIVLVGRNSVCFIQKFIKQGDYDNIEITELLTMLQIIAELKEKNQDSKFRELFQVEENKSVRVQFNLHNFVCKEAVKQIMKIQFLRKQHQFTFLLGLIKPQLKHASLSGVEIKLDFDFQYHDYTNYCNLQCHKAILDGKVRNYQQIYPIPS